MKNELSFSEVKRLSDETRTFAYESLHHKYGLDTQKTPAISLDGIPNFSEISRSDKYDAAITAIAEQVPVRICKSEKISGAAALGEAMNHIMPAFFDGKPTFGGVSHLTVDFFEVLEIGMDGIYEKIKTSMNNHTEPDKIRFLQSCLNSVHAMKIWHGRYINKLKTMPEYSNNLKNLTNVPFKPAQNFYEAVQSVWFCFSFLRLVGCWPGIGRIDVLLGNYLKKDLENGILTLDEAREILAHFFIKGCEWITGTSGGSGDAQHYQNIVLSGIDSSYNDVTNEVTYLVLDIIEETGISDFPITVRINKNTDEKLLKRISEVMALGGGIIAIYNEDLILKSLLKLGYPWEEAVCFANDGCWEIQIPGKTNFIYMPFDSLYLLQHTTLKDYGENISFNSFDELLTAFTNDLKNKVYEIYADSYCSEIPYQRKDFCPDIDGSHSVISLFEHDCIENAISYANGGTRYFVRSPHIGGVPDAVNSLYAIKKLVFDEKKLSFSEFMHVLKNNWEGNESLRKYASDNYSYYGNDNDEVDLIAAKILDNFSDFCMECNKKGPVIFVSGVSTFGRQIEWAKLRIATPFGKKAGEILSGNLSPTPGTDKNSVTSVIKSYCKADLSKQYSGAALDITLSVPNKYDEKTLLSIQSLIKSFVALGGHFMQINVADKQTFCDAKKNPKNYTSLSVRVSGWSARFVTLNNDWQDMIIQKFD